MYGVATMHHIILATCMHAVIDSITCMLAIALCMENVNISVECDTFQLYNYCYLAIYCVETHKMSTHR